MIENGGEGADGIRFLLTPDLKPNQMRGVLAVDLARLLATTAKNSSATPRSSTSSA